jgi:nicotine blue oxidoreductase
MAATETSAQLAVIHLVDIPDVGPEVVRRVVSAAGGNSHGHDGLARAHFDAVPGHPGAIGRQFWPELIARSEGDEGAREFLRSRTDVHAVECRDLATGRDYDVPELPAT